MAKKNFTVEQIIIKLRKIKLLCGQGKTIEEEARQAEITEQTYYRWRKEYGGMNTSVTSERTAYKWKSQPVISRVLFNGKILVLIILLRNQANSKTPEQRD